MIRTVSLLSLAPLAVLTAGCASSAPAPTTAAAPMVAPAAPEVVVAEGGGVVALEPGRFDMGKMWTFENAPLDYFAEAYKFKPSQEWLDKVRLAALRIPGCTASFVSANGLVATNHHCARGATTDVTREGENLLDDGFYAATLADERRAEDMWADQLHLIADVTALIARAVDPTAPEDAQVQAVEARMETVGDSASAVHGLQCSVTSLYQGARYSMYCYKRYTDVRLVMAPELQIGYFGGDADNFTYPRYNLDFSFFRVYDEDGTPLEPVSHFTWSQRGPKEGDATFVIGNPGSTERLSTFAQLEFKRDIEDPFIARLLRTRTDILSMFMDHHPEQRSQYINQWFGWMNSLKLYDGRVKALNDPEIMGRKLGFEQQFRQAVMQKPELRQQYGTLWDEIAGLRAQMAEVYPTVLAFAMGGSIRSQTLSTVAQMLQYAQASMAGTPDSALQQIRGAIERREINPDLDAHLLEAQIGDVISLLGEHDPWVVQALAGMTPAEAATAIVQGCAACVDPATRTRYLDDPTLIMNADELAFALVRNAMPRLQQAGMRFQQLSDQEQTRNTRLARALFDVYGNTLPPDATFTLRIADGVVSGYDYNGTRAPAWTTFYGMYDRWAAHKGAGEWALPDRWTDPPAEFDLSTPFDMVHTNDTVGGNSGSAVINPDLEILGLLFDGNIESLSGDFIYTTEHARSVSALSVAILEALKHVYHADRLVAELTGGN
ncbi:MAG: S46 family peptidase [Gemmatimonadales bacterium]|nr:S46 family peptidase [Gemmatimonadales bacterium]